MQYARNLTVLLVLFLSCLTFRAYGQDYIERQYRGDVIVIDTAVCMDVPTYRIIRKAIRISPEIVASQDSLLKAYQRKVAASDSLLQAKEEIINKQQEIIARKDFVIQSVVGKYDTLERTTTQTLNIIQSEIKKDKNIFNLFGKPPFWMGIGIGLIGGVMIMR